MLNIAVAGEAALEIASRREFLRQVWFYWNRTPMELLPKWHLQRQQDLPAIAKGLNGLFRAMGF